MTASFYGPRRPRFKQARQPCLPAGEPTQRPRRALGLGGGLSRVG